MRKVLILILTVMVSSMAALSQVTISGTVISKEDKSTFPGVNVVEKGTRNGTSTKMDGTFLIEVSDANATLVFSSVGMVTQEFPLKNQTQILVKIKLDCYKDFFDSQHLNISVQSGLINNPIGGQLELTSPWMLGGVIKGLYSYQTNLDENEFQNAQIEFTHYISNCDFDMDFRWSYRDISYDNDIMIKVNSIETDFNINNIKFTTGYTHLNFRSIEMSEIITSSGILIGLGTSFGRPLYPTITGKVAFYKDNIEYQIYLDGGYKRFTSFIKFYKLDSFNELSVGLKVLFRYRLKTNNEG